MTLFEVVSVVLGTGMLILALLTYLNRRKKQ